MKQQYVNEKYTRDSAELIIIIWAQFGGQVFGTETYCIKTPEKVFS